LKHRRLRVRLVPVEHLLLPNVDRVPASVEGFAGSGKHVIGHCVDEASARR
jgi:hypothetical protein